MGIEVPKSAISVDDQGRIVIADAELVERLTSGDGPEVLDWKCKD